VPSRCQRGATTRCCRSHEVDHCRRGPGVGRRPSQVTPVSVEEGSRVQSLSGKPALQRVRLRRRRACLGSARSERLARSRHGHCRRNDMPIGRGDGGERRDIRCGSSALHRSRHWRVRSARARSNDEGHKPAVPSSTEATIIVVVKTGAASETIDAAIVSRIAAAAAGPPVSHRGSKSKYDLRSARGC
jgi:hypothetical protein